MTKITTAALTFIMTIFALQACKQQQPVALGLTALSSPSANQQTTSALPLPERFVRVLAGKIDNQYAVQMELNRNKENLFGRYFYENRRDGTYLSLRGNVDASGTVKLSEYDGGKETGSFSGRLINETIDGESTLKFSGSWTNVRFGKALHFELVERRFDLGAGLRIITKEQNEEIKAQKVTINTSVAQLAGSGDSRAGNFNRAIDDFISQQVKRFKDDLKLDGRDARPAADSGGPNNLLDIQYKVLYADKNLISLLYTVYVYTGGAHGNAAGKAFNYDLNRGRVLELPDLFEPNAYYLRAIADHCIDAIRQRKISDDDWVRRGAAADRKNYASWNIVPQGLLITFDAYQVAAYAAGPQEVVVPHSALKGIIKRDGPLAALIK